MTAAPVRFDRTSFAARGRAPECEENEEKGPSPADPLLHLVGKWKKAPGTLSCYLNPPLTRFVGEEINVNYALGARVCAAMVGVRVKSMMCECSFEMLSRVPFK